MSLFALLKLLSLLFFCLGILHKIIEKSNFSLDMLDISSFSQKKEIVISVPSHR